MHTVSHLHEVQEKQSWSMVVEVEEGLLTAGEDWLKAHEGTFWNDGIFMSSSRGTSHDTVDYTIMTCVVFRYKFYLNLKVKMDFIIFMLNKQSFYLGA